MNISAQAARRIAEAVRKVEARLDDLTSQQPDEFRNRSRVPIGFYNSSSESVPPYGVLAVVDAQDVNKTPTLKCDKPGATADPKSVYAVNGPQPVASHAWGQCVLSGWSRMAVDPSVSPSPADKLGPTAGQWYASAAGSPKMFSCLGLTNTTNHIMLALLGASFAALTPRILYDDVAPGDTARLAYPVKLDSGAVVADTSATKVPVNNTFPGNFLGYGASHSGFDVTTGAKVWTQVDLAGNEQIVTGWGQARTVDGRLPGPLAATDASITGCTLAATDGGQSPGSGQTVYNLALHLSGQTGYQGPTDTYFKAVFNQRTNQFEFSDMPCRGTT